MSSCWLIPLAVIVNGATLGSLAVDAPVQTPSVLLSVDLPDNPTAGARLFAQKQCVRCHSVAGEGLSRERIGPHLGRIMLSGSVLDLAGAFWNHAPVMHEKMRALKIEPPRLTSREMTEIVAFLTTWRYYIREVTSPGNPVVGRSVYVAKGCAGCHDQEAMVGTQGRGPGLQRYRGRFSAIFLAQAMWNHAPEAGAALLARGAPWPTFTGREMADLVAFLQAGSVPTSEPVYFEPGSPSRGRDLFSVKRCDTCHAIRGRGGRWAPDLGAGGRELTGSVAEVAGLMWNHSQGMAAAFRRRGIPRVTFSGQEMADIIAYLFFANYANVRGHPARGREIFADKCSTCHSVGGGRGVGPDLQAVPNLDQPIAIIAAMWNHAPKMETELRRRGRPWPRLDPGDAADLVAFLITSRVPVPSPRAVRTGRQRASHRWSAGRSQPRGRPDHKSA